MRTYSTNFNFLIYSIFLLFFVLHFSACDQIIDALVDPVDEEAPAANNENDPDSENFTIPALQLIDHSGTHFILNETNYELRWEPTAFKQNLQYRYKVADPGHNLEEVQYSDFQTNTSILLQGLNETFNNEAYQFKIEVSSTLKPEKNNELEGSFEVDALQGRGFLFRPRALERNDDGSYTARIFADEIEVTDNLTALSVVIDFNSNDLAVDLEDITVFEDERSFLYRDGAEIISFSKVQNNSITIEAGVAGNNLEPLSGGGAICEINFTPRYSFSSSSVSISTSSILKTSEGSDIEISAFDEAIILQ